MNKHETAPGGPERVPVLADQPGDPDETDALQQTSRWGTYEVQSTGETEHFFPSIAAGRYDGGRLGRLRRQSEVGTDPEAKHDLTPE